jgi:hypothetical protein
VRLQSAAVTVSSRRDLHEEEIEQALSEELTHSDPRNSSSDKSSETEDLAVGNVIVSERNDNEDDSVQGSTASNTPNVASAMFTRGGMMNYEGRRG